MDLLLVSEWFQNLAYWWICSKHMSLWIGASGVFLALPCDAGDNCLFRKANDLGTFGGDGAFILLSLESGCSSAWSSASSMSSSSSSDSKKRLGGLQFRNIDYIHWKIGCQQHLDQRLWLSLNCLSLFPVTFSSIYLLSPPVFLWGYSVG